MRKVGKMLPIFLLKKYKQMFVKRLQTGKICVIM